MTPRGRGGGEVGMADLAKVVKQGANVGVLCLVRVIEIGDQ